MMFEILQLIFTHCACCCYTYEHTYVACGKSANPFESNPGLMDIENSKDNIYAG